MRNAMHTPDVCVIFTHDSENYQIMVDDNGPGIPENEREHIFEAFKRLDASRNRGTGGYGLGLAIVQCICQWHEGTARVEDSPLKRCPVYYSLAKIGWLINKNVNSSRCFSINTLLHNVTFQHTLPIDLPSPAP